MTVLSCPWRRLNQSECNSHEHQDNRPDVLMRIVPTPSSNRESPDCENPNGKGNRGERDLRLKWGLAVPSCSKPEINWYEYPSTSCQDPKCGGFGILGNHTPSSHIQSDKFRWNVLYQPTQKVISGPFAGRQTSSHDLTRINSAAHDNSSTGDLRRSAFRTVRQIVNN